MIVRAYVGRLAEAPRQLRNPMRFVAIGMIAAVVFSAPASAQSKSYRMVFTPFELRRMTNDPETNPALAHFVEKLEDPAAEALKVVSVAGAVSSSCAGVSLNKEIVRKYQKDHVSSLDPDKLEDARFAARRVFSQMDYVEQAELCAGVDYMFGPKGVLLPGAVSAGTGEMDLEPFLKDNSRR